MLSIVTATYNRSTTIERLYQSLKVQTNMNFEWIVIDDGSTDDTKNLINKYINEDIIKIKYKYKSNGGKHTAVNIGIQMASGDLITFVDSDDYLIDNAVEFYEREYIKIKNDGEYIGISGMKIYSDGSVIGDNQDKTICAPFFEFRYRMNVIGDRAEAFKSEIISKFSFPEFKDEKFVTEALLYNRIACSNKKFIWSNEPIVICEYNEDGLTAQGIKLFLNSWKGYSLYVKEFSKYKGIPVKKRLRILIAYFCKGIKYRKNIFSIFSVK